MQLPPPIGPPLSRVIDIEPVSIPRPPAPDPRDAFTQAYQMSVQWQLKMLDLIPVLERAEVHLEDGYEVIEEWVANTLGIGFYSACKFVQVALCIAEAPELREAFSEGKISYDHLRALSQIANSHNASDKAARKMPKDDIDGHCSIYARRADALVALADPSVQRERTKVIVHVDAQALAGGPGQAELEDGPSISIETAQRLVCDASVMVSFDDPGGRSAKMGRASRSVPSWLLQDIKRRDIHCRYPGCRRRKVVDVHQIKHWGQNGFTEPDNLVLLCERHHIYVHEAGYTVRGSPPKVIIERPGREPLRVGPPASMNDNNGPHRGPFPLLMDNVALWDRWRGAAR